MPSINHDEDRAKLGYSNSRVALLKSRFAEAPHSEDIHDIRSLIPTAYASRLAVLIPMGEENPVASEVIDPMIRYMRNLAIPKKRIIMATGGAHALNIQTAARAGATTINPDQLFDAFNWNEFNKILNSHQRPSGRAGKGFNVLGGYLTLHCLDLPEDTIHVQSDSEIANYATYAPFEHLLRAMEIFTGAVHVKMAKSGRNNNTTMVARNLLRLLYHVPNFQSFVPPDIQEYARSVYLTLREDSWMLTGEWLWKGTGFLKRPLASGYMEETLQAVWSTDANGYCNWQNVFYAGNKHPRQDGSNGPDDGDKETAMMSTLSQLLWALIAQGKRLSRWSLDDYIKFNTESMPHLKTVLEIGTKEYNGPVLLREVKMESLIPPIHMLIEAKILDDTRLKELVDKQLKGQKS